MSDNFSIPLRLLQWPKPEFLFHRRDFCRQIATLESHCHHTIFLSMREIWLWWNLWIDWMDRVWKPSLCCGLNLIVFCFGRPSFGCCRKRPSDRPLRYFRRCFLPKTQIRIEKSRKGRLGGRSSHPTDLLQPSKSQILTLFFYFCEFTFYLINFFFLHLFIFYSNYSILKYLTLRANIDK